jgi:ABC-type proline/glycine betaine transport system ATPase subunit
LYVVIFVGGLLERLGLAHRLAEDGVVAVVVVLDRNFAALDEFFGKSVVILDCSLFF